MSALIVGKIARVMFLVAGTGGVTGCSMVLPWAGDGEPPAMRSGAATPAPIPGGVAAVRSRVAETALKNRDFATAERLFREAHEADADAVAPLVGLGEALYGQGRHTDAIPFFRAAYTRDGGNAAAREGLAKSLIATGSYAEARELLEAAAAGSRDAGLLNKLGIARDLSGDGDGAQAAYRAALALEPQNASMRNNLGLSLAISGRYQEALKEMERAVATPPDGARYRGNLSFVRGLARNYHAALQVPGADLRDGTQRRAQFERIRDLAAKGDRAGALALITAEPERAEAPRADRSDSGLESDGKDTEILEIAAGEPAPEEPASAEEPVQPAQGTGPNPPQERRPPSEAVPSEKPEQPQAAPQDPSAGQDAQQGEWRVQLAAYRTLAHTQRGRALLLKRAGDLMPRLDGFVRARGTGGVAYRLRTPPMPDHGAAAALCKALQERGLGCLVIRHIPGVWRGTG